MGAEQSSSRSGAAPQDDAGQRVKTCYYELLGVERQASEDEIKKAYRRKALELHPDRNYGDVENATKLFAEIQSAYQVLSDPQERAWYDSHRDAILRDVDVGSSEHFEHDVRLTSAAELSSLMGKFKTSVPFTDAANGFYGKLRATFETLAEEEYAACDWEGVASVDYPAFGTKDSSYEDVVKPFYAVWTSFSTRKTFSWKDVHNYSEAPDRYVRRLMEKENKRLREDGIREFNDAVRTLVMFVRKRDPRYRANVQTEAERQKALKAAAAAQASRARAMQQAKLEEHVLPSWAQSGRTEQEGTFSESEDSEEEVIECVTCDKVFKSEKQYEAHEKSKKHIKAVQHLTRKMRKENKLFDLEAAATTADPNTQSLSDDEDGVESAASGIILLEAKPQLEDIVEEAAREEGVAESDQGAPGDYAASEDAENDEYAPREVVESRVAGETPVMDVPDTIPISALDGDGDGINAIKNQLAAVALSNDGDQDTDWSNTGKRVGKAKAKRAKKAAREATVGSTFTCATCNEAFPSKSKLFDHIKKEDHAQFVPKQSGSKKGKPSKK